MTTLGTALTPNAIKVMMLGSGELGKEVVIELQRLGVEVIAVDRYENAPAQQVAHRAYTISMLDGAALKALVEKERPDYIVPEVEAIATDTLVELEQAGFNVVPTAKATKLTMNREGIRRLAAEELGLPTSPYQFVDNFADFQSAVEKIGIPCVVKPIMSSSGHGQSILKSKDDLQKVTDIATNMVCDYGMSKLGLITIDKNTKNFLSEPIQKEINNIVNTCYENTLKILRENINDLHIVSKFLFENETMTCDQLEDLIRKEAAN